jgi:hypothetical protein
MGRPRRAAVVGKEREIKMTDWSKSGCGLFKCSMERALEIMPELTTAFSTFPDFAKNFTVDVKVLMLMPNQWPCIPNWHCDLVPRDENNIQDFSKVQIDKPLYLWLSGPPYTEFKDGRKIQPETWVKFNQLDNHRGTMSTAHQWRCFIRAAHKEIYPPERPDKWERRHIQVYLDVNNFLW